MIIVRICISLTLAIVGAVIFVLRDLQRPGTDNWLPIPGTITGTDNWLPMPGIPITGTDTWLPMPPIPRTPIPVPR